ncbi:hypothetical protein [Stenotrophomonas acidaminiphila]|uniref:hypothetical protein n=1 Tax=Stenotrophomonas acidaminiphila TaxID=128780 RepID=UPI0028AB1FE8|nr:hypothetical protein [Stenotrophomonas acidaminiphila]
MQPACIEEVAAAIGRAPSAAMVAKVEADLMRHLRQLARTEKGWGGLSREQRMQRAAEAAQAEALADAQKAADRKASRLVAQVREVQRMEARAAQLKAQGVKNPHHAALFERMRTADDYVGGVRNEYMAEIADAVHSVEPQFFGLMQNPENVRAFARAVMDGDTSNPVMSKAAQAYLAAMEDMRLRSNAAGTDIGQLDYGYLPQPHDVGRVARAGKQAWMDFVFPRLKRERYVTEDGAPMGDAEVLKLLESAYDTISTEGRNKMVPGTAGQGSRASRFDDAHRVLHFKDADAHLDYVDSFGRGSLLESISGHVGGMSKNIGLMEEFGANPNTTYRLLKDTAEKLDNVTGARAAWHELATLDMTWDTLTGTTAQPVSAGMARFFQGVRNFTTATKLQGVLLSSFTDAPLQVLVGKSAGIPLGEGMKSLVRGFGKHAKASAEDLALGMDEIAGEMARWHQSNLAQGWTAKLANTTMKLTLVEGWTNGLRRGFALTLSRALERHRMTDWGVLDEFGRRRLESAGVTEADWKIWQMAEAQDGMLTKNSIRAIEGVPEADLNRATARLLGYIDSEARTAVLAPDLTTRATIQQGTKAGTFGGEMLRSLMLFKSFPMAIVDKHLRRLRNIPTAQGKVAYSVAMMASLQLFGAVSMQLKDIVQGKDPRDMTTGKFWAAAAAQGGGLGVFGDILYTGMGGEARGGQANWTSLLGPVFGNVMDAFNIARKGAGWVLADEGKADDARRNFGAEVLRFTKGNMPFVNLWYLRAAVDHMLLHELQEQLSPGYLRRMRRKAQKEWGQGFWWEPGEATPERAPNLETAAGE